MNMTLWGKVLGYFLLVLGCFMVFVFLGASVIIVLTPSSPLDKSEGILTFASITFFLFLVSFFILKGFYTADRLLHNMDNQVFESFLTYMDRFFISVLPLFALSFDTSLTSFILILSLFLSPLIKSRDRFGNRIVCLFRF